MRALISALLVAAPVLLVAAPAGASDDGRFHCDGQDPYLFDEMAKAGATGFGETWDHRTCDQGLEVYAEGTTSRWSAFKPRFARDGRKLTAEQEMYGKLVPVSSAVALGLVGAAAGVMALVSRRARRSRVVEAPCPGCATKLPIVLDDKSSHGMFCPVCGQGSYAEVVGDTATLRSS